MNTTEKFLILAKHPEKGGFIISDLQLNFGLIGAILLEMTLERIIRVEEKRVFLSVDKAFTNPIINEIVTKIRDSSKPRKIIYWINRLNRKVRYYKWTILNEMQAKGLVRIEQKKFLFIIPYRRVFLMDIRSRINASMELKSNVLSKKVLSEENQVMLGLIEGCGLHKALTSDKSELKLLKKELKNIIKDNPIASEVESTIKQVQIAITTSIAISAATSAATR